MVFLANIPQPGDALDQSQNDLLNNNAQLDASFGVDHYAFSNVTSNNGKHNQVTTPAYVATPPTGLPPTTAANEPKFYGFQQTAPLGVLQYSRGPSDAVPTMLTKVYSPATGITVGAGGNVNMLDFTGITRAYFHASAFTTDTNLYLESFVIWNGTTFTISNVSSSSGLGFNNSGNIFRVQVVGAQTQLFWNIDFVRSS